MAELNPADQIQLKIDALLIARTMIGDLTRNESRSAYFDAIDDAQVVIDSLIQNYKRYIKTSKDTK